MKSPFMKLNETARKVRDTLYPLQIGDRVRILNLTLTSNSDIVEQTVGSVGTIYATYGENPRFYLVRTPYFRMDGSGTDFGFHYRADELERVG